MPQLDSTTFFSQIFFTLNQINTNNTQLITNFISNIKKYKFNNIFYNYIIKTKNVLI